MHNVQGTTSSTHFLDYFAGRGSLSPESSSPGLEMTVDDFFVSSPRCHGLYFEDATTPVRVVKSPGECVEGLPERMEANYFQLEVRLLLAGRPIPQTTAHPRVVRVATLLKLLARDTSR